MANVPPGHRNSRTGTVRSRWTLVRRCREEDPPWDCSPGCSAAGTSGAPTGERPVREPAPLMPTSRPSSATATCCAPRRPEQIEQAHAEAFAKLTPDQRQQVLAQLAAAVPAGERPRTDDPRTLARAATRAEMRQPGHARAGVRRLRLRARLRRRATAAGTAGVRRRLRRAAAGRGWAA